MSNNELEESIYEFGHVMKCIGKCETDDKVGMKEYVKLINRQEALMEKFKQHFKCH